jgi:surface polysaccharide O-acyltransferase-like enzyme
MLALFVFPFLYNLVMVCLQCWWPDFNVVILGKTLSLQTLPLKSCFFTLYSVLYFMLGGILFRKKLSDVISVISLLAGWALVVFDVIVSSNYSGVVQDAANTCFPTIGAMLISIGIFNLFRNFDRIKSEKFTRAVSWLGPYVLPIYLFHLQIVWKIYIWVLPSRLNIVLVLLLALVDCAACVLIGFVLKKIPLVKELLKM